MDLLGVLSARSIPAHAGEPPQLPRRRTRARVYPRPRGGAATDAQATSSIRGLSPPTRGSQPRQKCVVVRDGSIPAHAGEPTLAIPPSRIRRVYPRPRGGAGVLTVDASCVKGLSPPTRGSREVALRVPLHPRSIPAHAGEPRPVSRRTTGNWVYPRPRGGATLTLELANGKTGLSPPTRGSRSPKEPDLLPVGSIPAHAGEPVPRCAS